MKKLGRGWQYTVYDLGNGRVLKCWNSRPVAYMMMCSDRILALRFWRFPMYYRASTSTATYSLRELKKSPLPMSLFGNPKYLENGFDYEQDKLLPIDEYLKTVSIEKQKEMVDKFVVFNKFLIQNSCIDKSFNMGTNFALGKGGNIVLSDIGELYFTEKLIAQQINRKAWAKPYVLGPLPKELRSYFLEKMESLSFLYMQKTCIDKLAFVELKDRKVLETKSKGKDIWYIPGGKRDEGESDEQALVREIKEELNVEIDPTTIVYYGTFEAQAHGKPEGTMVRMTCYQSKYRGELTPSAEVEMMDWFDYSKKELTSPVDHLIFDDLKAKDLID